MKSLAVTGRIAALLLAGLSLNTTPLLAADGNPGGIDDGNIRIDILGGLPYVDVEAKLSLDLAGPRPGGFATGDKDSVSDWNGVLGTGGRFNLTEH